MCVSVHRYMVKLAQAALVESQSCSETGVIVAVCDSSGESPCFWWTPLGAAWQWQQLEKRRASTRPARQLQHNKPHLPFGSSCCRQESRNHVQSYFSQLYSPVIRLSRSCQAWLPRGQMKGFLSSIQECCCKRMSKHVALMSSLWWYMDCGMPRPTLTGAVSLTPCSFFLPSCGYLFVLLSYT